jgi:DNA-binding NtrC family response regulator
MLPVERFNSLNVLSVSSIPGDHVSLDAIIGGTVSKLFMVDRLSAALGILPSEQISVVLCERDLSPGAWTDLLEHLNDVPHAPTVIVASRLANEQIWAEALNPGAWDVLAKPFERTEVLRTIGVAWHHWNNQRHFARVATNTPN